ncbi:MAG TPA: hypothetical protein VFZ85_00330 [Jiangellaceae bacterium]
MTGEFVHAEDSDRSRRLTETWNGKWPDSEPVGHLLRGRFPERWVRFHSLPASKRYAETESAHREILHRHRTVLSELLAGSDLRTLVVVAEDWGSRDLAAGWSKRHLEDPWPWKVVTDGFDPEAGRIYCWVQSGLDEPRVDALLRAAAEDRGHFLLADPNLDWLYCPYDGGADVLVRNQAERDTLRDRHIEWLSSRDDGL